MRITLDQPEVAYVSDRRSLRSVTIYDTAGRRSVQVTE